MDRDILVESQVEAANPRRAYVDGYALHIGRRATLVPISEARAYGMIFALTHNELERLYSALGCELLNRMRELGRSQSYRVSKNRVATDLFGLRSIRATTLLDPAIRGDMTRH